MDRFLTFMAVTAVLTGFAWGTQSAQAPKIVLETELGDIVIELYPDKAPLTAGNFLRYLDESMFRGVSFYRVVRLDNQPDTEFRIEVIQGGMILNPKASRLPPIEHETTETTGLLHKDGVISMARSQPGSATSEFFICLGDQPELDFGGKRNPDLQGFAAFGRVVSGMEVVRAIHGRPADGQMLLKPVAVRSIRRAQD